MGNKSQASLSGGGGGGKRSKSGHREAVGQNLAKLQSAVDRNNAEIGKLGQQLSKLGTEVSQGLADFAAPEPGQAFGGGGGTFGGTPGQAFGGGGGNVFSGLQEAAEQEELAAADQGTFRASTPSIQPQFNLGSFGGK